MNNSGKATVAIKKPFVLTRVTYSRLITSQTLRIGFRDLFNEDIIQRRFHQFKPADASATLDGCFQNNLGIRPGKQFGLHRGSEMVDSLDQGRLLQESVIAGILD